MTSYSSNLAAVLPRAWLNYYGLKKGDKVELITNSKITIRPLNRRRE